MLSLGGLARADHSRCRQKMRALVCWCAGVIFVGVMVRWCNGALVCWCDGVFGVALLLCYCGSGQAVLSRLGGYPPSILRLSCTLCRVDSRASAMIQIQSGDSSYRCIRAACALSHTVLRVQMGPPDNPHLSRPSGTVGTRLCNDTSSSCLSSLVAGRWQRQFTC